MRFVIIGAGPAGNTAATVAGRYGAEVTLVERDVIGGAAHLWDCIPSKAMIATGGSLAEVDRARIMGLAAQARLDLPAIRERVASIEDRLHRSLVDLLGSQGVRMIAGTARLDGPRRVVVEPAPAPGGETGGGPAAAPVILEADAILLAAGSRPRVPDWAPLDGERVLTTRQAYPPAEIPEHAVVIGSGVTGVEFTHMFASFGSEVSLIVSRQQVLPTKDPEVAAALETEFLRRGVHLYKGARAAGVSVDGNTVRVSCDDGRVVVGTHAVLAVGSIPNSAGLGLESAGVKVDAGGYVVVDGDLRSSVPHIFAAGDLSGKLPLSSVAAMQGRRIAETVMGVRTARRRVLDYDKAASAIFTEPEIADVGVAEAEAFSLGRKLRVTKVPWSANAKALILGDSRGFVKIVSDPATGVVLGGSIVGRGAAELISVLAVAVTCGLRVGDLVDSILVHPALSESLVDAAE